MSIEHFCSICNEAVEEFCAAHPGATIDSIYVQPSLDEDGYAFLCDRCGDTARGDPAQLVDASYLLDDPWQASSNLCPTCAADDDPHHIPGSWLLAWE